MKNTLIIAITIAIFSTGCATIEGVKQDSSETWHSVKKGTAKTWEDVKEGTNNAWDSTKKAYSDLTK